MYFMYNSNNINNQATHILTVSYMCLQKVSHTNKTLVDQGNYEVGGASARAEAKTMDETSK
jgi:hypothetical protein